jgi:hypothetical protein
VDHRELRDVRRQDLRQPRRLRALLQAQPQRPRLQLQELDQRLAVGLHHVDTHALAARIDHRARRAWAMHIQSDQPLHRRPPLGGE